ncbi:MmpS family transport accessory protein [Flavobacterium poyangense]|uniref:MmpS family transport accessory protein n=1 Tax=Flavobacterium poyangense TaxID=2204302 RepID=UPI0014202B3A|nr:MmpS family transport accessory protein [Flavobacterium sp. JXAS1]
MKKILFALTGLLLLVTSCSNDNDKNPDSDNSRKVKYELTGTFSKKIRVTYINESGGNVTEDNVSIPWSKEVTFGKGTFALGISGTSVVGQEGTPGQTLTAKIFVNGTEKKVLTNSATNEGIISCTVADVLQ